MIANICKYYFADNWHTATKYIQDIGGGIIVTAPSSKDFYNPETHDFMEKYFAGRAGVPTEHRLRMAKLIRDLTSSYEDVLTIHAEGSLEAQKMSILQLADWGRYTAAAKRAAGIPGAEKHPVFAELPEFPPKLVGGRLEVDGEAATDMVRADAAGSSRRAALPAAEAAARARSATRSPPACPRSTSGIQAAARRLRGAGAGRRPGDRAKPRRLAAAGRLGGRLAMKAVGASDPCTRPRAASSCSASRRGRGRRGRGLPAARTSGPATRSKACSWSRWLDGNREFLAGLKRDPVFGPVVAFGLGGVLTEVVGDVALALAPLERARRRRTARSHPRASSLLGPVPRRPAPWTGRARPACSRRWRASPPTSPRSPRSTSTRCSSTATARWPPTRS